MVVGRLKVLFGAATLAVAMLATDVGVVRADSATLISTAILDPTYSGSGTVARGSSGGVLVLSDSRSVSHTRSGSVGVSWSIINGAAGFNVTSTFTVTYSYQRSAPNPLYCYKISAHDRWKQYKISWHHVGWGPLPNSTGTLTVKRHNGVSYQVPTPYRAPSTGICK